MAPTEQEWNVLLAKELPKYRQKIRLKLANQIIDMLGIRLNQSERDAVRNLAKGGEAVSELLGDEKMFTPQQALDHLLGPQLKHRKDWAAYAMLVGWLNELATLRKWDARLPEVQAKVIDEYLHEATRASFVLADLRTGKRPALDLGDL